MSLSDERAAFETWWTRRNGGLYEDCGGPEKVMADKVEGSAGELLYRSGHAQDNWIIWQAAAAVKDADDLVERLKLEAQIHAQEARTANATIAEIYQTISGGTGEPGNWRGAEPVRQRIAELEAAVKDAGGGEAVAEVSRETFSNDGTSDIMTCNLPIGTKLYTRPQASATVPEAKEFAAAGDDWDYGYVAGWNNCRTEMLAASQQDAARVVVGPVEDIHGAVSGQQDSTPDNGGLTEADLIGGAS